MISPLTNARPAGSPLADGFAEIERTAESAVDDLARMISVDTSFPPGAGYDAFSGLMESAAATHGLQCQRVDVPEQLWCVAGGTAHGARTNLIARRRTG